MINTKSDSKVLTLADVLMNIRELPSLPSAINAIIVALKNDALNVNMLAHDIARDQALAARVLRVANSPFYGVQHKVASIHDAVVVLGLNAVGSLVTAASLTGFFKPGTETEFDLNRFWRHSIGVALCSRALARGAKLDSESGFSAGLLHDIGVLLLVTMHPTQYKQVLAWRNQQDCLIPEAEMAIFGFDHTAVGAALSERWRFPEEIVAAVKYHHHPQGGDQGGDHVTLADVVHVADAIAHALDLDNEPDAIVPPIDEGAWQRLNLTESTVVNILEKVEQEHAGYCALLAAS
jgi:putative nucleotidyltransferase with HDIG domain